MQAEPNESYISCKVLSFTPLVDGYGGIAKIIINSNQPKKGQDFFQNLKDQEVDVFVPPKIKLKLGDYQGKASFRGGSFAQYSLIP